MGTPIAWPVVTSSGTSELRERTRGRWRRRARQKVRIHELLHRVGSLRPAPTAGGALVSTSCREVYRRICGLVLKPTQSVFWPQIIAVSPTFKIHSPSSGPPPAVRQVFSGPGPRVPGQRSASTAPQVHVLQLGTCDLNRTVTWPSTMMGHTCHHRSDNLVPKGKTRAGRSHHTISEIQPGKCCVVLFVCLFLKFLFLLELLARSSGFFVLLSQSPFLFL